jgi:translation initiation factor IF-2
MIVAINKIDKPDANPERVRTELLQHEIRSNRSAATSLDVEVSAKNKTNLDKLLEKRSRCRPNCSTSRPIRTPAEGTVIEAKLDRGRGPVATVLVQRGTLKVGDIVVAGAEWGRVRALINDKGETIEKPARRRRSRCSASTAAGSRRPSRRGRERSPRPRGHRAIAPAEAREAPPRISGMRGSLEQMMSQLKTSGRKEFPLIVKADVQGSLEAILGAGKARHRRSRARILHAGVGGITESDVTLAEGSGRDHRLQRPRQQGSARAAPSANGIEIRYYNIIYDLVDDVKKRDVGPAGADAARDHARQCQILEVFNISKVGKVAGCRVTDGTVERGANVRLIRDNVVVHEGKLSTLKRFKDEVAPKIGLRVVPDLKFLPDTALDEATKINQLLHAPEVLRDLEK